jgi:hypothetical protein
MSNRHPADQMASVRSELAQLKRREAELRAILLVADDLCGDEWQVQLQERTTSRLNIAAAREGLGDALNPYMRSSTTTYVLLRPRSLPVITLRRWDAPDPKLIPRRASNDPRRNWRASL